MGRFSKWFPESKNEFALATALAVMSTVFAVIYWVIIAPNADESRWGLAAVWTAIAVASWVRIVVARRRLR